MEKKREIKGIGIESPVAVYQEEGRWIAHCLALDLLADGATEKKARDSLIGVISTQIDYAKEHRLLDSLLHMAPKEYWDKYKNSPTKWRLYLEVSYPSKSRKREEPQIELEPSLA